MSGQRLAIVVKYFPPYPRISGILTYVSLLAAEMGRRHDVHVVTSELPAGSGSEVVDSCTVHRVGWPFPVRSALALRSIDPDVVLTVSGIFDLRQGATYFLPGQLAGPRGARRHFYQATWPSGPPGPLFRALVRGYDGVLAASDGIRQEFERNGVECRTVAPAVDVARLAGVERSSTGGALRVGFVNHLNEVKGADIASAAIERLAAARGDMEFVIAGVGELESTLRARHGSDPRVAFSRFLPERERLAQLASCDVMLLPFRQAASVLGVSQTALEVMALGNVVVGSTTASLQGAIEDDRNGVLIDLEAAGPGPAAGAEALAGAVLELDRDRDRLERLRRRAASDAAERWDIVRRAAEVPAVLGLAPR